MSARRSPLALGQLEGALRRATHPPVRELRFWAIQAMVVVIAGAHLVVDLHLSVHLEAFPDGLPVALLMIPVGYAALHYGLSGSAATGAWAALLWLPDLVLPHDRGHAAADVVNLALVEAVAFFVGQHIEGERLAHAKAEQATAESLAVEARYRQLFEANRAPILVLDGDGLVTDSNPAARRLFGHNHLGRPGAALLEDGATLAQQRGRVQSMPDGRDYRVEVVALPAQATGPSAQVILEDVTEERSDWRRATRYAQLLVQAEEDQRQRLARELHDEPLQLFLHLARSLERLGETPGLPEATVASLGKARHQALDAATRLRTMARDLRPPALDQLGLVPALSSLLADVEEESGIPIALEVEGSERRLPASVELGAFRIAEEAVRNALRHAGSERLEVAVGVGEGQLTLRVADDGKGFVPDQVRGLSDGHLGLLGMRERATLLGGHLEIRSLLGEGTVIEATLPLASSETVPPPP